MAKILVVEDDAEVRVTTTDILTFEGYEVTSAESVPKAQEILTDAKFDLILSDFWLAADTAVDLIELAGDETPVIVFSGGGKLDLESTTALSEMSGSVAVLFKPISRTRLLKAVSDALSDK